MSWFTQEDITPSERLARASFLWSVASGQVLKLLVQFAPEAANQCNNAKKQKNISDVNLGALIILQRQGYAKLAADAVATQSQAIAKSGGSWGLRELEKLLQTWGEISEEHGQKHAKKTFGRAAAQTVGMFLSKLISYIRKGVGKKAGAKKAQKFTLKDWHAACRLVGQVCHSKDGPDIPRSAGVQLVRGRKIKVDEHIAMVHILSKLPFIDKKYGACHILRAAHLFRVHAIGLESLPLTPYGWQANMGMTKGSTEYFNGCIFAP